MNTEISDFKTEIEHFNTEINININISEDGQIVGLDGEFRDAAEDGHIGVIKFLVEQGADIHAWYDYSLRLAAINGHLEVINYLKICQLNFTIKKKYHEYR
jgi:hypothetical protein